MVVGEGADGQHHGLQPAFDALGDLDLAFTGEQLHGAHLAHVHAHRVGGAAELGIDRRERGFGSLFGLFFRRGGGATAGDQERRRVGCLLVDGDAHVVEHRDDRLEDLVVDELLGQVVVDLLVGQEAARLAHLDERLQLLAALGDLFFGELGLVEPELAHQRALLGAADLHAQRLGLGGIGLGGHRLRLALDLGLDVGQVDVGGFRLRDLGVGLALLGRRALGLGRYRLCP